MNASIQSDPDEKHPDVCPQCGYDVSTIASNRCPECGCDFKLVHGVDLRIGKKFWRAVIPVLLFAVLVIGTTLTVQLRHYTHLLQRVERGEAVDIPGTPDYEMATGAEARQMINKKIFWTVASPAIGITIHVVLIWLVYRFAIRRQHKPNKAASAIDD